MKTVMVFNMDDLKALLAKSNIWYTRHYEEYFDRVYVLYLRGEPQESVTRGRTTLISLATGRGKLDFLLTPYRVYRAARELRPTTYVTLDIIWGWWLMLLVRLLTRARVHLSPQINPWEIHRTSGRSITGVMPVWLERFSVWLSLLFASRLLTARGFGNFKRWMSEHPVAGRKLVVVDTVVEALPPPAFFERMAALGAAPGPARARENFETICVGRLHPEKLMDGLVRMVRAVKDRRDGGAPPVTLTLVGDGPQRAELERMARDLGVADLVRFTGQVRNEELPDYLARASAYVSSYTGMSFREAALFGLPIVSYEVDWLSGFLLHEDTVLLAPVGDHEELARQVARLADDGELYARLARNLKDYAWKMWSPLKLRDSMGEAFGED